MSDEPKEVKITSINIGFLDLVRLLAKVALASIPAAVIVALIYTMIYGVFVGFFQS